MYTRIFSLVLIISLLLAGCGSAATSQPTLPAATQATSGGTAPTPTHETPPDVPATEEAAVPTYPVVDTAQGKCYDNMAEIDCPADGAYQGQDAQYTGLEPGFTKNNDGTITDKNTGLTWQQSPDSDGNGKINAADKLTYMAAGEYCGNLSLAGKDDWRLPDIKTLYSLIDFRGTDPGGVSGQVSVIPFLDTGFFDFAYGDSAAGESTIDAQFASGSVYADTHTGNGIMDFAVNFAEGSLKGYGLTTSGGAEQKFYVLCVRGDDTYGANHFGDNGDGSVTDQATGLVWQKADSTRGMNWQEALAYCEGLSLAGKDDWRLPDAKSLQSLVDYSRSPATTQSAAIDALFSSTAIKNEAGQDDYPYYWTSTTHLDYNGKGGNAVSIAFGRAMGFVKNAWVDLYGAGAQSSDPKSGAQSNAARGSNFARCVRGGNVSYTPAGNPSNTRPASRIDTIETSPATATPGGSGGGDGGGGSGGGVTPPSPEAIAACSSSTVGDACHFSTLFGEVNGTCRQVQIPDVIQVLACVINIP